MKTIECTSASWSRSSPAHDQAINWSKATVRVYSDSILCLGKISDPAEANRRWEGHVEEFQQTDSDKEFCGIDGEPNDFELNIFPLFTSLEILQKIQKDLQEQKIESENFEDRFIFMSMFNDIEWTRRGNSEQCISSSDQVKSYAKKFSQGHWTFLGPGSEKKWNGNQSYRLEGKWQATPDQMVERFEGSGQPVFKSVSPLARGILRRKNNKEAIHFIADAANTELLYRTLHSPIQLSIHGAVASWCEKFCLKLDEKLPKTKNDIILKDVQPKEVNSLVKALRNKEPAPGNRLREVQQNLENLGKKIQFRRVCEDLTFIHKVAVGTYYRTV